HALKACRSAPVAATLANTLVSTMPESKPAPEREVPLTRNERAEAAAIKSVPTATATVAGRRDRGHAQSSTGALFLGLLLGFVLLVMASGAGYYLWQRQQNGGARNAAN